MTTPNGNPAWTRSADHTFYGGHADKANYNGEPVVNPRTDVGADSFQRMAADLAAVARMTNFCTLWFTANSAGSSISVTACSMMTGKISAAYAGTSPPAGFPSVTHVSAMVYSIDIGGSYSDDYSVAGVFAPAFCGASAMAAGSGVAAYVTGTSTVIVSAVTGTGTYSVWIA